MSGDHEIDDVEVDDALPGAVGPITVDMPRGYKFGVTRYADKILAHSFPNRFAELTMNLDSYFIDYERDIVAGGGSRARHTQRHDEGLENRGWHKRNVEIEKFIDGKPIYKVRNHEIDVFKMGDDEEYPGIAVEMEWNNKDPFFHRDLNNFQATHREGVIAVGVVVTRGPRLQQVLEYLGKCGEYSPTKYGKSTTHWNKLTPMVDMGAGGECPLLCIGIEPERVRDWPWELLKDFRYDDGSTFASWWKAENVKWGN